MELGRRSIARGQALSAARGRPERARHAAAHSRNADGDRRRAGGRGHSHRRVRPRASEVCLGPRGDSRERIALDACQSAVGRRRLRYGGAASRRARDAGELPRGRSDQPVIVGRAFNATAPTPYALPDNKTRTSWRSSSKGGGNELTFEDKDGGEMLYVHAQRDLNKIVNEDELSSRTAAVTSASTAIWCSRPKET